MTAPLAVFGYNRPESLRRLFQKLDHCPEIKQTSVTVFIDGPRTPAEAPAVEACVAAAADFARQGWAIHQSPVNKGLKRSITDGVSSMCAQYGSVVVIEDDLVPSPAALTYFNDALERYKQEDRVWSVCGYGWRGSGLEGRNNSFFLPLAHPWGWATWDRAWSRFDIDAVLPSTELLESRAFRRTFDLGGLIGATDMLALAKRGLIDSWFIRWYLTVFRHGGLSLFPTDSLIANMGFSGGTHAGRLNPYRLLMGDTSETASQVPGFPGQIECDYSALDALVASRDARVLSFVGRVGYLRRMTKDRLRAHR